MSKNNRRLKISFNSPVVLTFAILMFVATLLGILDSRKRDEDTTSLIAAIP